MSPMNCCRQRQTNPARGNCDDNGIRHCAQPTSTAVTQNVRPKPYLVDNRPATDAPTKPPAPPSAIEMPKAEVLKCTTRIAFKRYKGKINPIARNAVTERSSNARRAG